MDRITSVRISNVRAIKHLELDISQLTVLIGENGAGKSTIIECLELLRKAASPAFLTELHQEHRGQYGLLRHGESNLTLGVRIEADHADEPTLDYSFTLRFVGGYASVQSERLWVAQLTGADEPLIIIERRGLSGHFFDQTLGKTAPLPDIMLADTSMLTLTMFGMWKPLPALTRLINALASIQVQLGFDTLPYWVSESSHQPASPLRTSAMLRPARSLSLRGRNLANAWAALKNSKPTAWAETLSLVQLGLGDDIEGVVVLPDPSGGHISLALQHRCFQEPIFASNLSDGQLTWLCFVAMVQLDSKPSLLAIDEPELHLHPYLLGRVVGLLQRLDYPVLVSTHSNDVLSLLHEPADSLRVCSLEEGRAVLSRLDANALPQWLDRFRDLGELRASGYLSNALLPVGDADEMPEAGT